MSDADEKLRGQCRMAIRRAQQRCVARAEVRIDAEAELLPLLDRLAAVEAEHERLTKERDRARAGLDGIENPQPIEQHVCPECQGWDLTGHVWTNHARTCSRRRARWFDVERAEAERDQLRQQVEAQTRLNEQYAAQSAQHDAGALKVVFERNALRAERDLALQALQRVTALHHRIEASSLADDCATGECYHSEHGEDCQTIPVAICDACFDLVAPSFDAYAPWPTGTLWPCATAVALSHPMAAPDGDPVAGEGNPSTDPYIRIEQLTQENAELWAERDQAYERLAEHGIGGVTRSTFARRRRQNPTAEQIAADEGTAAAGPVGVPAEQPETGTAQQ